mgnify:CR=1 FL=1
MAEQIIKTRFKIRRGTSDEWKEVNPILLAGEPGYATDVNIFKIGDGVTPWNKLPAVAGDTVELNITLINGGNAYGTEDHYL